MVFFIFFNQIGLPKTIKGIFHPKKKKKKTFLLQFNFLKIPDNFLLELWSLVIHIMQVKATSTTGVKKNIQTGKNVLGYYRNLGSLSVGHYELCRDDIGDLPGSPEHL